jgi:hypothetical protein
MLPCKDALFCAENSKKWSQMVACGELENIPTVTLFSFGEHLGQGSYLDTFNILTILSMISIHITESYNRLMPTTENKPEDKNLTPSNVFSRDPITRNVPRQIISLIHTENTPSWKSNLNSMTLWNYLSLLLTADIRLFELAAGRDGKEPAENAHEKIAIWTQKPSARRAVLHAAQIYALVSHRKLSDSMKVRLDTVPALFSAALVLCLYLFHVQPVPFQTQEPFELLDEVNWERVDILGMLNGSASSTSGDSDSSGEDMDPAIRFIKFGGLISFSGDIMPSGCHSTRRVLLAYAKLLEGLDKWSSNTSTKVLHTMADTLMHMES